MSGCVDMKTKMKMEVMKIMVPERGVHNVCGWPRLTRKQLSVPPEINGTWELAIQDFHFPFSPTMTKCKFPYAIVDCAVCRSACRAGCRVQDST